MPKLHFNSRKFLKKHGLEIRWNPLGSKKTKTNVMATDASVDDQRGQTEQRFASVKVIVVRVQHRDGCRPVGGEDVEDAASCQMGSNEGVHQSEVSPAEKRIEATSIHANISRIVLTDTDAQQMDGCRLAGEENAQVSHRIQSSIIVSNRTEESEGKGEKRSNKTCTDQITDSKIDKENGSKRSRFEWKIEELKVYKENHGHLNIRQSEDQSLAIFCASLRNARGKQGKYGLVKLTEEHIFTLDALGFDWMQRKKKGRKSFYHRVDDLKAYKEKHGHLNVNADEDQSLFAWCIALRKSRSNTGKLGMMKLTDDHTAALDAIGFDWRLKRPIPTTFHESIEQLKSSIKLCHVNKNQYLIKLGEIVGSFAQVVQIWRIRTRIVYNSIVMTHDSIWLAQRRERMQWLSHVLITGSFCQEIVPS